MTSVQVFGSVRELHRSPEHRSARGFDVTVAVPFANSAATLGETLESLLSQGGGQRTELLLISNGTTDDSVALAVRATRGAAVRIVECDSVGYDANARNVSMTEAGADRILFIDSDDVVDRNYVAAMCAALDRSPFVTGQWDLARLNPHLLGRRTAPDAVATQLPFRQQGWPFAGAGSLGMRSEVPATIGGFNPALRYGANNEWCFRAYAAGFELSPAADAVLHVRLRGSTLDVIRQHYRWAVWEVAANAAASAYGLPRRGVRGLGLTTIYGLLVALRHVRTPLERQDLAALVGRAAGRMVGSVQFRRLDL